MDLGKCTRCIFISLGLLIIICYAACSGNRNGNAAATENSSGSNNLLNFCKNKVFIMALIGIFSLLIIAVFYCYCHVKSRRRKEENLDKYAPRTQSIVWPS